LNQDSGHQRIKKLEQPRRSYLGHCHPSGEFYLCLQSAQKQEPFQVQVKRLQIRRQILGHQEFHTILLYVVVFGEILPPNVGTDRYLSKRTGSTGNAHQVNSRPAALLLDVG